MMNLRPAIASALHERICRRLAPFPETDWRASAVIFAPHPDDETLGCGGVALKKIAAGAALRFVFVTDGAASHSGSISSEKLREMRAEEALEAVRRLGGRADDVTFLRFPDGRARDHVDTIGVTIEPLLRRWKPDSVYVTHAEDPPSDHKAVHAGVLQALRAIGRPVTVFEYPIWYWHHWPWVRIASQVPNMWRMTVRQTLNTHAGLRALSSLNVRADISDVLAQKKDALAAHVSQMQRLNGDPGAITLSDLSEGDFLSRLLSGTEMFKRYEL